MRQPIFLFCFFLYLFICGKTGAQTTATIDSLQKVLAAAKHDSDRIKINIAISAAYGDEHPDKGFMYAQKAMQLAKKTPWPEGLSIANCYLGWVYMKNKQYDQSILYFKVAEQKSIALHNYDDQYKILINLGNAYGFKGDTATRQFYRNQCLQLSRAHHDRAGEAMVYVNMGNDYAGDMRYDKIIYYWTQAAAIYEAMKDYCHVKVFENVGLAYQSVNDGPNAEKYYRKYLTVCIDSSFHEMEGVVCLRLAEITDLDTTNKRKAYEQKMGWLLHALVAFRKEDNQSWIAYTYDAIGSLYITKGIYDKAIENFLKGIAVAELAKDGMYLTELYNDITLAYMQTGDYDKALAYLFRSEKFLEKKQDLRVSCIVLSNIGACYVSKKDYKSGLEYLQKALVAAEKHVAQAPADSASYINVLNNLADFYLRQKKVVSGLSYLQKSQDEYHKPDISAGRIKANLGIAYLMIARDSIAEPLSPALKSVSKKTLLQKSIGYLNEGINIALALNAPEYLEDAYKNLSEAYGLNGDYKNALTYYRLQINYRDSLLGRDKIRSIDSLDLKYDYDKRETIRKAEQDKQAAIQRTRIKYGSIGGAAFLLMTFAGFFLYRKREKDKILLEVKALRQEALNAQMSDHFIGNSMNSINHFIQQNDKTKASEYLIRFSRLIRNVLENATQRMVTLDSDLKILRDYLELEKLRFEQGMLDYEIIIGENIDAGAMLIPPMVFQTLAENSIKHGFKKTTSGKIVFSINRTNELITCRIEDNGVGRKKVRNDDHEKGNERSSIGGSIAERLVKTVSKYTRETSYRIIDLLDGNQRPIGTLVEFTIPYLTEE